MNREALFCMITDRIAKETPFADGGSPMSMKELRDLLNDFEQFQDRVEEMPKELQDRIWNLTKLIAAQRPILVAQEEGSA